MAGQSIHSHGLYLSVQPILEENAAAPEVLADRLSKLLCPCPENRDYLDRVITSQAPPSVQRQRLTALECLLTLLCGVLPNALPALKLRRDEHGRPYAEITDAAVPRFDFNLSHTNGYVACGLLIGEGRVGVDIESLIPTERAQKLSARFFSTGEQARLAVLSDERAGSLAATRIWTAKEALSKQDGRGYPLSFDTTVPSPEVTVLHGVVGASSAVLALCVPAGSPRPSLGEHSLPISFL